MYCSYLVGNIARSLVRSARSFFPLAATQASATYTPTRTAERMS
jgi:hypothetical protein